MSEPAALRKPRIVQAADAVAYLPLYTAELDKPSLILEDGVELSWDSAFDPPYRVPPRDCLDGGDPSAAPSGDRACLNAIQAAWKRRLPLIGICDPCAVADYDDLVLIGSLIDKACFWCLADEESLAKHPAELDVTHLCIHHPDFETGYHIGDDVMRMLNSPRGRPPRLLTGPFELLVDGAVWLKNHVQDSKTAAISASVLSCTLAEKHGMKVAFAIHAALSGYSRFLTTGIVVHREALQQPHVRTSLILLIRALNYSKWHVAFSGRTSRLIMELCNNPDRFVNERRLDCATVRDLTIVWNEDLEERPLAEITESQAITIWKSLRSIYGTDCRVSRRAWKNAQKARRRPPGQPIPRLDDHFDRTLLVAAKRARLLHDQEQKLGVLLRNVVSDARYVFRSAFEWALIAIWWMLVAVSAASVFLLLIYLSLLPYQFKNGAEASSNPYAVYVYDVFLVSSDKISALFGLVTGIYTKIISLSDRICARLPSWVRRLLGPRP